jgi:hypothetical protein
MAAKVITAVKGRLILCIGYSAWGRGHTSTEAIKNWRKNAYTKGDGKMVEVYLYDISEKTTVNEMGQITRPKDDAPAQLLETRKVKG